MNRRTYIQQTTRLLGFTLASGAVMDLLVACEQNNTGSFKPVFFSETEAKTLASITDTICPKTNTPGANELGVPQFIDALVHTLLKKEDQEFFKKGIVDLDNSCQKQFGKAFIDCDIKQKETILLALDQEGAPTAMTMWGKPMEAKPVPINFYRKVKNLTLLAYFTSEKIGKQYLAYDPVPGAFQACIPYHNEASWTE